MKKSKRHHAALPMIVLALYVLSVAGMIYTEKQLIKVYYEHTQLVQELANATAKEQKELKKEFAEEVRLTGTQRLALTFSTTAQKIIDTLTPGKKHCLYTREPKECKVYLAALPEAANERNDALVKFGNPSGKESILFGKQYNPLEYLAKIITLAAEAFALSVALAWLMPRVSVKDNEQERGRV